MKFLRNHPLYIITLTFILLSDSDAREAKEYDNDVNYEETKIPHYDLPELLIGPDGKKISSTSEWEDIRRPQILSLYSNLIYGRINPPAKIDFPFPFWLRNSCTCPIKRRWIQFRQPSHDANPQGHQPYLLLRLAIGIQVLIARMEITRPLV